MEKAYFPMDYYRLTQGYGSSSSTHKHTYAIDIAGKDSGKDKVYAPFTGTIKKIYKKTGVSTTVWLESNEKVLCANGEVTYLTCLFAHEEDVSHLFIGKVIKQGEAFLEEGRSGNATGNHIHLELSNQKFSKAGWFKNSYGEWQINNPVKPDQYLFLKKNQKVLNDVYKNVRYPMKIDSEFTYSKEIKIGTTATILLSSNLAESEYKKALNNISDWIKKALT